MVQFIAAVVSVLGINGATAIYKNAIAKYGDTKIHIFIFFISAAVSGIWAYAQINTTFMTFLIHAGEFGMASIATYEIFFKQLGTVGIPPNSLSN